MDIPRSNQMSAKVPLCVDLDGTLVKTDMFWESFLLLMKKNIFYICVLPLWMLKGKAFCKAQIAERVSIDVAALPYHPSFLDLLKTERQTGRQITLATGTDCHIANNISKHLGVFGKVFASDGNINLTGKRKMQVLEREYGKEGFDYAGNSTVDLSIWQSAQGAIVISNSKRLIEAVRKVTCIRAVFPGNQGTFLKMVQSLRPIFWATNLLVVVPYAVTHTFTWSIVMEKVFPAFLAFSLVAAGAYILDDLFDLQNNRRHPQKKFRPFAAGDVPIVWGLMMTPLLFLVAFGVSLFLPLVFQLNLWGFLLLGVLGTLFFSSYLASHVIMLAGLYTLRITGGAAAIEVPMLHWFLVFPIFLLVSFSWIKCIAKKHRI